MIRALLVVLGLSLGGCSFTVAQGFNECTKDADCGAGRVCLESFCLNPPEGCGTSFGAVDEPRRIVLGAALPLTTGGALDGGTDESEAQGLNAITLALDEVNQRDGVGGRPFALYLCNTGGDKERIKAQTTWLAEQLKVPALFTSGSAQTLAATSVTVPHGVVIVSATSTSPELTSLPDSHEGSEGLLWRTAPSDAIQGRVIADLLLQDPAFSAVDKVGVLYVDDPYGQGLKQVLADRYVAPGKQVRTFQYSRGGQVISSVSDLGSFAPQVTVLIGFPEDAVRILAAAQAHGSLTTASGHRWFFTDSAKDPALLEPPTPPSEVALAYGTAPAQGAGSAFQAFADRFQSKYQVDPRDFSFTSHSYDAMYVVALASAFAAGSDGSGAVSGARIAEGLTKLSSGTSFKHSPDQLTPAMAALQKGESIDVEGASGKLDFDPSTGEAPSPIDLWQVSADGKGFAQVRTIEAP